MELLIKILKFRENNSRILYVCLIMTDLQSTIEPVAILFNDICNVLLKDYFAYFK